jgi:hypothetical protein
VIGDTPYDAEAARKVGVCAIGTTTGGFTQTKLENAGCAAVCLGPHELAEYLSNPAAVADQFAFSEPLLSLCWPGALAILALAYAAWMIATTPGRNGGPSRN